MRDKEPINQTIALFPLQTVLYPAMRMPLRIFEPRYVDLIGQCMRENDGFGIVAIKLGSEVGRTPETFTVGTEARIVDFDRGADGLLNVVVEGGDRFDIFETRVGEENLLYGSINYRDPLDTITIPNEFSQIEEIFRDIKSHPELGAEIKDTRDCSEMIYQMAPLLPLDLATKVSILNANTIEKLLVTVESALEKLTLTSPPPR